MHMQIGDALDSTLQRFQALPPSERLTTSNLLMEELKVVTSQLASSRRAAVREMRSEGYTLKEIAEIADTTIQRIHQIESGYNRHEQKARKQAD
jgi:DNA-directed RNA polymerase specialized sigma24 family protein